MPQASVRLLIPTSGRKRPGGDPKVGFVAAQAGAASNRFRSLTSHRLDAIRALRRAVNGQNHADVVLRKTGSRLEEATQTVLDMMSSPVRPAIERELGPLFLALDVGSLQPDARRKLDRVAVLVCPLMGVMATKDLVPNYFCPVGAQIPTWGSLHTHWKERLKPVLDRLCRKHDVVSFLPSRLQSLWTPTPGIKSFWTVQCLRSGPDGGVHTDHAGQRRVSGEMIRFLLLEGDMDPMSLKDFRSSLGHRFTQEQQEPNGRVHLIYRRR